MSVEGGSRSQVANFRSAAQWILISAGAVLTALLTRLPSVDSVHLQTWGSVAVLGCLLAAMGVAMVTIFFAARVFAVRRDEPTKLAREHAYDEVGTPDRVRALKVIKHRHVELLGSHESLQHLLLLRAKVHKELQASWGIPSPAAPEALRARLADLDETVGLILDAIQETEACHYYSRLLWWLRWVAAPLFTLAVVAYALIPLNPGWSQTSSPLVQSATPVLVTISDEEEAGVAPECGDTRHGVAIGGTLLAPVVVLDEHKSTGASVVTCPATVVRDGFVAVPIDADS